MAMISTSRRRGSWHTVLCLVGGAAFALAAGAAQAQTRDEWSGTYGYTEDGGRTAGGTGIVVTHEIAVARAGGAWRAEITANGHQTQTQIHALGTVVGNRLQLRFERDGEDQMFKGRYRAGALLLELERPVRGGLLTHWHAYTPATMERYANPGTYFRR
jgi:hypothetical protein